MYKLNIYYLLVTAQDCSAPGVSSSNFLPFMALFCVNTTKASKPCYSDFSSYVMYLIRGFIVNQYVYSWKNNECLPNKYWVDICFLTRKSKPKWQFILKYICSSVCIVVQFVGDILFVGLGIYFKCFMYITTMNVTDTLYNEFEMIT